MPGKGGRDCSRMGERTFNSLFEMPPQGRRVGWLPLPAFNSLFEMHVYDGTAYSPASGMTFNSLFEMPPRPPLGRALGFEFLSILYLRCETPILLRQCRRFSWPFNSLFEMPRLFCHVELFVGTIKLSILYLRCRHPKPPAMDAATPHFQFSI